MKSARGDAGRWGRALFCTVALAGPLACIGPAHAQNDDVMGFGAAANPPSSGEAALLPPPGSYLSDAWSFWPHAWGYVPSLWSSWYVASQPHPPGAAPGNAAASTDIRAGTSAAAPPPSGQLPALLSGPDSQGLPPPRLVRRRRYNLIIAGAGLLLATWATDRLLAQDLNSSPWSWVPLVGPWYLLGEQSSLASPSAQTQVFLVIDGILQAGGLTMAIFGAALTTKRYVVTVKPALDLAPRITP